MSKSQGIEVLNRYEICAPFLRADFVPYLPAFASGVNVILYREEDGFLFKVQLKSHRAVDRKCFGRDI